MVIKGTREFLAHIRSWINDKPVRDKIEYEPVVAPEQPTIYIQDESDNKILNEFLEVLTGSCVPVWLGNVSEICGQYDDCVSCRRDCFRVVRKERSVQVFQVGDKVVFKTWEEMKEEYGLTPEGNINCGATFTSLMDRRIDRNRVYTIENIDYDNNQVTFEEIIPGGFYYSIDMIKLAVGTEDHFCIPVLNNWNRIDHELFGSINVSFSYDNRLHTWLNIKYNYSNQIENILKMLYVLSGVYNRQSVGVTFGNFLNSSDVVFDNYATGAATETNIVLLGYDDQDVLTGKKNEYLEFAESRSNIEILGNDCYKLERTLLCILDPKDVEKDEWWTTFFSIIFNYFVSVKDEHYTKLLKEGKFVEALTFACSIKEMIFEEKRRAEFESALKATQDYVNESMNEKIYNTITNIETKIKDHENCIMNLYEHLRENQKTLAYIRAGAIETKNNEFVEILRQDYENISQIRLNGSSLGLLIKQPLLFFEDEDWLTIRKNVLEEYAVSDTRYVIDNVFKRRCELMLETGVWIMIDGAAGFRAWTNYNKNINGIPNSHIYEYNCWGDNKAPILNALHQGKYDIAYAQIKSALAGINIMDSPVVRKFCISFSQLCYQKIKCIRDYETGQIMTIPEANEYYRKQEEKEHEEN